MNHKWLSGRALSVGLVGLFCLLLLHQHPCPRKQLEAQFKTSDRPIRSAVSGAQVTSRNRHRVSRTVTTNSAGFFAVANLQPSNYTASVTASGFLREIAASLPSLLGKPHRKLFLKIGVSTEEVEVRDTAAVVDLVTSDLSEWSIAHHPRTSVEWT